MPQVLAVIPMKPLAAAKSRLAPHVSDVERAAIACHLAMRVVAAAAQCPAIAETWVVGGDGAVQALARQAGAKWFDDGGAGLNAALDSAFARWFAQSGDAALFLPADLPLVTPAEVAACVEASGRQRYPVLVPAARDGGSNAVLMPRNSTFAFLLGEQSFKCHLAEATRLGYQVVPYFSQALGLDVDTIDDLRQWRSLRPDAFVGEQGWTLAHVPPDKLFRESERSRRGH
ncbi:MAG: 2-phospho-L-lactate guanylyltransferase [Dehalococcoidia bacterium]|nr:2-phospho-L-lactate guanylyltransferase [Dehalococcoidia bacterium]